MNYDEFCLSLCSVRSLRGIDIFFPLPCHQGRGAFRCIYYNLRYSYFLCSWVVVAIAFPGWVGVAPGCHRMLPRSVVALVMGGHAAEQLIQVRTDERYVCSTGGPACPRGKFNSCVFCFAFFFYLDDADRRLRLGSACSRKIVCIQPSYCTVEFSRGETTRSCFPCHGRWLCRGSWVFCGLWLWCIEVKGVLDNHVLCFSSCGAC